jgi:hypothetical protein
VLAEGWRIRLDLAPQVLQVDIPERIVYRGDARGPREPPLWRIPPRSSDFVSAATLLLKAKQFDDGLVAAVELAAQAGAGTFVGKAAWLVSLAEELAGLVATADADARSLVFAACQLGGLPVTAPANVQDGVRAMLEEFLRDELRSKPLGFYTWTPQLEAIYRQDRILKEWLQPETAAALQRALDRAPGARTAYERCRRLDARLTNPPASRTLLDSGTEPPLFPPSRSNEVDLFQRLYGDREIPNDFDLAEELVRQISSGAIRLDPMEDSGWYDYQTWSLEPLVLPHKTPEAGRLQLGNGYRRHLRELFKGTLAMLRETHVRRAGYGGGGYGGPIRPTVRVSPGLTVEPLATLYRRRALCYRFIRGVLEESFGAEALAGMHRLTSTGPTQAGLADELGAIERLFTGAYLTVCREFGMEARMEEPGLRLHQGDDHFRRWAGRLRDDPDLGQDARMMVPVFYDVERRQTKVWAFLGWESASLQVQYVTSPRIISCTRDGRPEGSVSPSETPDILFGGDHHELATPVVVEVYVRRLLNRDEFRRHCDRYRTRSAILANLR